MLAPSGAAFGEVQQGLRVARDLVRRGEDVVFSAPAALAVLFEGEAVAYRPNDDDLLSLPQVLRTAVQADGLASLTLVDLASSALTFDALGIDIGFVQDLPIPVLALDFWNLAEAGLRWDFGTDASMIASNVLKIERRLVPVPVVRPDGTKGAFRALPEAIETARDREAVRAELGLGVQDRLVLFAQSRWQDPEVQNWKHHARIARGLPSLLCARLAELGERVHLAHVSPVEFASPGALGPRCHWLRQLAPARFQELLAAADVVLSFNATGVSTVAAVAVGVPVLLGVNSRRGKTVEEVVAMLPAPVPAALRDWLSTVVPLYPFLLWPLGLYEFLSPVLRDNPYLDALCRVEILDHDAFMAACQRLLFDPVARESLRSRQHAYCQRVADLPSPADVFLAYL
ncbi:MAG TPA: DUF6365 family protein [Vicinamibacteria bacterium]|nr:DUF6365 family protein [Vicinamibacteria bacterium]